MAGERGDGMNYKRVQPMMRRMNLEAIYPRPKATEMASDQRKCPNRLGARTISKPEEAWAAARLRQAAHRPTPAMETGPSQVSLK